MLDQLKFIDLTHPISEQMPQWPTKTPFSQETHMRYHTHGAFVTNIHTSTGSGTHIDAPIHFIEGGRSVDQLTMAELYSPAVVIDIEKQSQQDPDYALQVEDIKLWIEQHGPLPANALVIAKTGWFKKWDAPKAFNNLDAENRLRFPGFSPQAADFLLENKISGIAIDTASLDCGIDDNFPVHKLVLGQDKYQVENLANLDAIPVSGAYVLTCPMKIEGAPEAFSRVLAVTKA